MTTTTTLHDTTLKLQLHFFTLQYTRLHYTIPRYSTQHYSTLQYATLIQKVLFSIAKAGQQARKEKQL